jgi:hypothetical protein
MPVVTRTVVTMVFQQRPLTFGSRNRPMAVGVWEGNEGRRPTWTRPTFDDADEAADALAARPVTG